MGKQWKWWLTFFGAPKSLQMVTAAMKLKDTYSLEGSYAQPQRHIKKQRHYFFNKGLSSQGYGFSSIHVWMWVKVKVKSLICVWLFVTPWTVAYQAPPSMGFSRQECWSGLPLPSPGDLPDPGIEPGSPTLQADALLSESPGKLKSMFAKYSVCWKY